MVVGTYAPENVWGGGRTCRAGTSRRPSPTPSGHKRAVYESALEDAAPLDNGLHGVCALVYVMVHEDIALLDDGIHEDADPIDNDTHEDVVV